MKFINHCAGWICAEYVYISFYLQSISISTFLMVILGWQFTIPTIWEYARLQVSNDTYKTSWQLELE